MSKHLPCGPSLALLLVPTLALAQTAGAPPVPEQPADLQQVVVVANRTPEPLDTVGNTVTVLDQAQITASQAVDVATLLDQTPGVDLNRNGGSGQTTSISIRGADTDQTLVLIDGVKLNDPSQPAGGFDFSNLLVGDISRIEILRGAQSTLWGSQAIGGIVNIVTAEPTEPFGGSASIEGGSRNTQYYRAAVGGRVDDLSVQLAGGYYTTDGISAFDKLFGGRELDGYHDATFSGRLRYAFTPEIDLDLRGYYTTGRTEFDGFDNASFSFGDDAEFSTTTEYVNYTGLNFRLLDGRFASRVAFQYTDTDRNNYDPVFYPGLKTFFGDGTNLRVEYQGTFTIADGYTAVFGAEHERSTIDTTDLYDPETRASDTLDSGYGQLQAELLPGLDLTGGARYDDHDVFGGHATGQAALAWSPNDGATLLRASFGQGFKAPALYQLFSNYGNQALRPETADSWDAGIEQRLLDRRLVLRATYFGRRSHDLIQFFDCFGNASPLCATRPFGYYANIGQAQAQGAEFEGSFQPVPELTLAANYTYTAATDESAGSPTDGLDLARRPRSTGNLSVSYLWPIRLSTTIAVRYQGQSYDNAADTIRLKGFATVDLRAAYPIRDDLELYARVENLFDRQYETAYRYGSLDRGFFAGLRTTF